MKLGTRESEEKLHRRQNDGEVAVWLRPIKSVGERLMYHNCASLCSLCETKESG
jgi:hypothetical protein